MKHFPKILCIFFLFCTISVHAQKEKVEFPYSHESVTELLKDSNWLKASAAKYLQYINNGSLQPIFPFQASAYVILNKNEEGIKLVSGELSQIEKSAASFPGAKVLTSIMYGYFYFTLHPAKDSYYNAVQRAFEKLNPLVDDRKFMYEERERPETSGTPVSIINSANQTVDSAANELVQLSPSLKNLTRSEKVLSPMEMAFILLTESGRKIAVVVKDEQIKFANDQLSIINSLDKNNDVLWETRLYHFLPGDHPQTIVAANFQVFDKKDFPASQIWVNKKEIPNNGIDDDKNGFIDDINGLMFIKNKKLDAVGIPLEREKAKTFYDAHTDRTVGFQHGTMTVELMLKDNPYVKIMGLEHNQYDLVWKEMLTNFTKDINHNRKLIDSLIDLRLRIWKNLVLYCKQNNVRVAEINSLGFLLNGDEFVLTGCGKDSVETQQYTEKKFWQLVKGYEQIFKLSPNTLFIIAGGNKSIDNNTNKSLELCIHTPNTLTVGALGKDLKRIWYSNYGKDVEIYAPAVFDLVNHKDSYAESSGTSAASPVVCNLAIKLFCLNPKLSPVQVKKLMIESSDKDLFEKGINVINPKKAVALMKGR